MVTNHPVQAIFRALMVHRNIIKPVVSKKWANLFPFIPRSLYWAHFCAQLKNGLVAFSVLSWTACRFGLGSKLCPQGHFVSVNIPPKPMYMFRSSLWLLKFNLASHRSRHFFWLLDMWMISLMLFSLASTTVIQFVGQYGNVGNVCRASAVG